MMPPASARVISAAMDWWVWSAIRVMVPAAIRLTPPARPSSPSIRLMVLVMPTSQNTVRPTETAVGRSQIPSVKGFDRNSMRTPR
ncbi:hypothetical protein D3C87_1478780 [compost metagenome]